MTKNGFLRKYVADEALGITVNGGHMPIGPWDHTSISFILMGQPRSGSQTILTWFFIFTKPSWNGWWRSKGSRIPNVTVLHYPIQSIMFYRLVYRPWATGDSSGRDRWGSRTMVPSIGSLWTSGKTKPIRIWWWYWSEYYLDVLEYIWYGRRHERM